MNNENDLKLFEILSGDIVKTIGLLNTLKNHLELYEKYKKNKEFLKQLYETDKQTITTIRYFLNSVETLLIGEFS